MRRREFIGLLVGAAVTFPLAARAQQAMPVIGFLHSGSPQTEEYTASAFREGLKVAGYSESQNVLIEYRWAQNDLSRLAALATDLVRREVKLIFTGGGTATIRAAKAASATIPIVFTLGVDPVRTGIVQSFARPGGNITGATLLSTDLGPKRLELLQQVIPNLSAVGFLVNPDAAYAEEQIRELQESGKKLGIPIHVLKARGERDLEPILAQFAQRRGVALVIAADPIFNSIRTQITTAAARHSLPGIFLYREYVQAGGLMSYGTIRVEVYRQAGMYAGRILKGEKPADLPVLQPTKFELVVNLKTAKSLGLTIPPTMLARADEVIE